MYGGHQVPGGIRLPPGQSPYHGASPMSPQMSPLSPHGVPCGVGACLRGPRSPVESPQFAAFVPGEVVEVFSKSRQEWLQGTVVDFAQCDGTVDGIVIPAGSVKVSTPAGVKWILSREVSSFLRRPREVARPSATSPRASRTSSVRICKNNCGRTCQPGLTRSMQPYDTCCKKCASDPDRGEHDDNCGGQGIVPKKRVSTDNLVDSFAAVVCDQTRIGQCFDNYAAYAYGLNPDQAFSALDHLLADILSGEALPRPLMFAAFEMCDEDKDGVIHKQEFEHFCRQVFSLCFPKTLTVSTTSFVKRNFNRVTDVYSFGDKLGEGSFGVVYQVQHKISGQRRVCKKISRGTEGLSEEDMLREIYSMAVLDHPNVLKVYEFFSDKDYVSQILEPCQGGELQDRITGVFKKGHTPYGERFMCDVMKQTLRACAFMHSHRPPIVHKDLKPQNIMMEDRESSSIKVIDFGLAELFQPGKEYCNVFGGTLLYMAPEVFAQQISVKVDVWSAGVILYNLITGDFPYSAPWPPPPGCNQGWWEKETARKICNEPMQPHPRLGSVRRECQDLLRSMLNRKVEKRPDASQCLDHPWFKIWDEEPPPLSVGVSQCLEAFSRQSELKKAIFLLMARECEVPALLELRALFTHFDVKNQGRLEARDLREVFSRCNLGPVSSERVLHALDRNGSGSVCWTEFLAAALCVSLPRNPALVDGTFAFFDDDHDGKISSKDFLRVLAHGEHTEEWKKTMPALFSEVLGKRECVPGACGVLSVPMSVLKAVVKPVRGEDKISKAKFRAYVTAFMEFSPGQELHAGG